MTQTRADEDDKAAGVRGVTDIGIWPVGDELLVLRDVDLVCEVAVECAVAAVTDIAAQRYRAAADHEQRREAYPARNRG